MRISWGNPNERYFQHGLDQGVLYPSTHPEGVIQQVNYVANPRAEVSVALWSIYGLNTTNTRVIEDGRPAFLLAKTVAGSQFGMRTASPAGLFPRPAGKQVTISAWVKNPVGQAITAVELIARDDTNADSIVLTAVTAGSLTTNVPANGTWTRVYATGSVKAARNLEAIYVTKSGTPLVTEKLYVRDIMVNDGTLQPYFDGNSPEDLYEYAWTGTPLASSSVQLTIEGRVIPWNGLVGFDEGSDSGDITLMYRDGILFNADVDASDFSGKLNAMMYPEEFGACIGIPRVADGLYADSQKPKRFSFAYRTLVGSGAKGDMFGYQIHLVYNCMATIAPRSRRTIGKDTEPVDFSFDIVCTPVKIAGFRPTAHYVIDTRGMSQSVIDDLEALLYGSATSVGQLPHPQVLFDMMNFGDAMIFTVHPNGTYTVEGKSDNLYALNDYHFQMKGINAVASGVGNYIVSDGGDTDVIIEAP